MKARTTLPAKRHRRSGVKALALRSRASASSGLWVENLRPGQERDTQLMPWLIADTICGEAARFLGVEIPTRYLGLDKRAVAKRAAANGGLGEAGGAVANA